MSYRDMLGVSTSPKWLEFNLVRDSENIPYTLSDDELAEVLYKRFGFGEFDVLRVDQASMKTIKIQVNHAVDLEKHKPSSQLTIRPGLYVQAMKEVKIDKLIKLSWVPAEASTEQICEVLEMFGKVTKKPVNVKFSIKDNAPEITKRLRNVISENDKQLEMLLDYGIPSYIKILDKKVKVWYRGQPFNCARCYLPFKDCPGRAIAKECQKKNEVPKKDFETFWKEVLKTTPRKPTKQTMRDSETHTTETVKIFNFPHQAESENIKPWLQLHGIEVDKVVLHQAPGVSGVWFLTNLGVNNVSAVVRALNNKKFNDEKKLIMCSPVNLTTPEKTMMNIREPREVDDKIVENVENDEDLAADEVFRAERENEKRKKEEQRKKELEQKKQLEEQEKKEKERKEKEKQEKEQKEKEKKEEEQKENERREKEKKEQERKKKEAKKQSSVEFSGAWLSQSQLNATKESKKGAKLRKKKKKGEKGVEKGVSELVTDSSEIELSESEFESESNPGLLGTIFSSMRSIVGGATGNSTASAVSTTSKSATNVSTFPTSTPVNQSSNVLLHGARTLNNGKLTITPVGSNASTDALVESSNATMDTTDEHYQSIVDTIAKAVDNVSDDFARETLNDALDEAYKFKDVLSKRLNSSSALTSTQNNLDDTDNIIEARKALQFTALNENENDLNDMSVEVDENDDHGQIEPEKSKHGNSVECNDAQVSEGNVDDDVECNDDARVNIECNDDDDARVNDDDDALGSKNEQVNATSEVIEDKTSHAKGVDDPGDGENEDEVRKKLEKNRKELEETPDLQTSWITEVEKHEDDIIKSSTPIQQNPLADSFKKQTTSGFARSLDRLETRQKRTNQQTATSRVTTRSARTKSQGEAVSEVNIKKPMKQSKLVEAMQYSIHKTNERSEMSEGESSKRPNSSMLENSPKHLKTNSGDGEEESDGQGSFTTVVNRKSRRSKK